MEGKTQGKDMMLICKGWYDRDKYRTTKDALISYYNKNYRYPDDEVETLDYDFINKVLLKPAIQELLTERFIYLFIDYLFDTTAFHVWKYDGIKIKELIYEEELYYRLIGFLGNLVCVDANTTVNIDTSEYWLKKDDIDVRVDSHRILVEDIIA